MEEDEIQKKQLFLRTEIMNKGYDTDSFINFLEEKKSNDFDIKNFSMEDLKKVSHFLTQLVSDFKVSKYSSSYIKDGQINQSNHNEENKDHSNKLYSLLIKRKAEGNQQSRDSTYNVSYKQNGEIYNYGEIVECLKLESSILADYHSPKIIVSKPEKHKGGLFSTDYITYLISTENLGLKVRRRYSDFEWLRQMLILIFPGSLVNCNLPIGSSYSKEDRQ